MEIKSAHGSDGQVLGTGLESCGINIKVLIRASIRYLVPSTIKPCHPVRFLKAGFSKVVKTRFKGLNYEPSQR